MWCTHFLYCRCSTNCWLAIKHSRFWCCCQAVFTYVSFVWDMCSQCMWQLENSGLHVTVWQQNMLVYEENAAFQVVISVSLGFDIKHGCPRQQLASMWRISTCFFLWVWNIFICLAWCYMFDSECFYEQRYICWGSYQLCLLYLGLMDLTSWLCNNNL